MLTTSLPTIVRDLNLVAKFEERSTRQAKIIASAFGADEKIADEKIKESECYRFAVGTTWTYTMSGKDKIADSSWNRSYRSYWRVSPMATASAGTTGAALAIRAGQ
jgi:hypothetical protein